MTETTPAAAPPGCPAHAGNGERTRIYDQAFANDPYSVFTRLRETYGPIAPVEIAPGVPAHLVVGYEAALEMLRSPARFSRDPRRWQETQPPDCPVLPIMGYRPNVALSDGSVHERYRATITSSMDRINTHDLRAFVEKAAQALIAQFGPLGEADLMRQFAVPVSLVSFDFVFGCSPEIAERMRAAVARIIEYRDPEKDNLEYAATLMQLVALKRREPGNDVPSWMMEHPAGLTDEEMVHQLALMSGAGVESQSHLIGNTIRQLFVDGGLADGLGGGSMSVEDALDEVLWTDTPVANYSPHYPHSDTVAHGTQLAAAEPVLISFAGANHDPAIASSKRPGNRAHLAWGAGAHACPAQSVSRVIVLTAIETLMDTVPDLALAVPPDQLVWRPNLISRGLTALPVRFTPLASESAVAPAGEQNPWSPAGPAASPPQPAARAPRRRWWSTVVRWWRGN